MVYKMKSVFSETWVKIKKKNALFQMFLPTNLVTLLKQFFFNFMSTNIRIYKAFLCYTKPANSWFCFLNMSSFCVRTKSETQKKILPHTTAPISWDTIWKSKSTLRLRHPYNKTSHCIFFNPSLGASDVTDRNAWVR